MTLPPLPLYPDGLVLVTLSINHNVCLIQNKHRQPLQIQNAQLETPIQNGPGCPDHYVVRDLAATRH